MTGLVLLLLLALLVLATAILAHVVRSDGYGHTPGPRSHRAWNDPAQPR